MAGFLANPNPTYLDDDGTVLGTGSYLYCYEVSSTTPKAMYPTIADAIAQTNGFTSIALDSAGRASVVLGGQSKLVLKRADATTVWTKDYVSSDADILDANGNVILSWSTTASAVNHVQIKNAATGNPAIIDAVGTDTTPNLKIQADGGDGTVTVVKLSSTDATLNSPTIDSATITNTEFNPTTPLTVAGTSSGPAEMRLAEDTDNGTNYVGFSAPSSISANKLWELPAADGGANTAMMTNASGVLSFSTLTLVAATQAQQEAGTSAVAPVVPSVQQYHPSAAKCWCLNDMAGNIGNSYNVTSITDGGTGITTVTIATDFSSSSYVVSMGSLGGTGPAHFITSQAAGSYVFRTFNSATLALQDPSLQFSVAFGDQ